MSPGGAGVAGGREHDGGAATVRARVRCELCRESGESERGDKYLRAGLGLILSTAEGKTSAVRQAGHGTSTCADDPGRQVG